MAFDTDLITGALVIATGGLIYATLKLKAATEVLGRNQILPRLSISGYRWSPGQLWFSVKNNGFGTAYSINGFGEQPTGVTFNIETSQVKIDNTPITRLDLPVGESISYILNIDAAKFREFKVKFRYTDANNRKYTQNLTIPK